MTKLTQLLVVLAFATTVALAQPTIKVSGLLGEVTPIRMLTNSRGDTVVSARTNTSAVLLLKLANQSDFTVAYNDQGKTDKIALGGSGNPFTNDLNIQNFAVYFTTLDSLGTQRKTWEMPLSSGPAKMLGELGMDVKVLLVNFNYSPVVKKLELVSAVREDSSGRKLMYAIITGYLGYFSLQPDGSFREVMLTGHNQYIFPPFGVKVGSTDIDFTIIGGAGILELSNYNLQTKTQKLVAKTGSSVGNESLQTMAASMDSWKKTTFRYKTANGGRVAQVVDGQTTVLYASSQAVDDHAVNIAHLFVRQGNRVLMVDGLNSAIPIASVGDTFAGKTIREFSLPTLTAHGCSVNFMAKTDTTSVSGSPHLFTTALPCVLQVPTTEVKVGEAVILYGQNLGTVNDTKIVDADNGNVYTPNLITNDTVVFTAPRIGTRFKVKTKGLTSNTFTVRINSAVVPVIDKITTATGTTGAVAPNGLFTVWGQNLSPIVSTRFNYYNPGITVATRLPLPRLLAGAKVLVNGAEIPLLFGTCYESGICQFNAQAPSTLFGTTATVEVQRYTDVNGRALEATSQKFTVAVQPVAPVVFSFPKNEETPDISELTVMQNGDKAYQLVTRSTPMKGGQTVVLYSTGFGLTSPEIPVGEAAGETYAPVTSQVKTWLKYRTGGNEKTEEAGNVAVASPQFPGVNQVNVKLPVVLPDPGTKTFLVVKVGEEYVPDIELPYN